MIAPEPTSKGGAEQTRTQVPVRFIHIGKPTNFTKAVKFSAIVGELGARDEYRITVEARNGEIAPMLAAKDFITEAFNVAHETGLTPRQLNEHRKELRLAAIAALAALESKEPIAWARAKNMLRFAIDGSTDRRTP